VNSRDDLQDLLDLHQDGPGTWVAATPTGSPRRRHLFGGLVAGQALRAGHLSAGLDRLPHSMHAYFLREGRFGEPMRCEVDASRDGRSFAARRIEVHQSEGVILTMLASFQRPEDGDDYELASARLSTPGPETVTLPTGGETGTSGDGPFQLVEAEPGAPREGSLDWSTTRYWCRARERLPDDLGLHASTLVAMGDLQTVFPLLATLGTNDFGDHAIASLDYAVWFHRPARADEWLLYDLRPSGNAGARGLTYAVVHDAAGRHVASFAMELLLRRRESPR
jgi:acyl-CoA thioesterase-2